MYTYMIYINLSTSLFSDLIYKTEKSNNDENDKDLSYKDSSHKDPSDNDFNDKDPVYEGDSNNDPSNNDPSNNDPNNKDPLKNDPNNKEPSNNEPCSNKPEPCNNGNGHREEESFEIEEELAHIRKLMRTSNDAMILNETLPFIKGKNSHLNDLRKDPHVQDFFEGENFDVSDLPELNKALVEAKKAKKKELSEAKRNVNNEYTDSLNNKDTSSLHPSNKTFNKEDYKHDLDYKYNFDYKLDNSLLDFIIKNLKENSFLDFIIKILKDIFS